MKDSNFQAYSEYYDLLYADKDYKAEAEYILGLLSTHSVPAAGSMLELGCGTGAHAELFAEKGWSVHGIDISPQMLERALRRAAASPHSSRLNFELGDVRNFRADIRFDCVVSLFHVASYQTSNSDLESMFRTAALHLKPGGVFFFDFWYGPAVLSEKPSVRVKHFSNGNTRVMRIAEPESDTEQNIVDVNYSIYVKSDRISGCEIFEKHRMRYLFLPEIIGIFERSGLKLVSCSAWMSDERPSVRSWAASVLATRLP